MAEQEVTAVLSNMSVVKMPEDYADYIEKIRSVYQYEPDRIMYLFF